ncbi:hypothetical protein J6590_007068 [Homalodisca vitripennis]|nr:hypothetical protein J6590_007068 [Homalodisca vitripennis]
MPHCDRGLATFSGLSRAAHSLELWLIIALFGSYISCNQGTTTVRMDDRVQALVTISVRPMWLALLSFREWVKQRDKSEVWRRYLRPRHQLLPLVKKDLLCRRRLRICGSDPRYG